jgi:hypothetical protein
MKGACIALRHFASRMTWLTRLNIRFGSVAESGAHVGEVCLARQSGTAPGLACRIYVASTSGIIRKIQEIQCNMKQRNATYKRSKRQMLLLHNYLNLLL